MDNELTSEQKDAHLNIYLVHNQKFLAHSLFYRLLLAHQIRHTSLQRRSDQCFSLTMSITLKVISAATNCCIMQLQRQTKCQWLNVIDHTTETKETDKLS